MGSLSGLFNITRNALMADQTAINTTATNIANQNTAGYSKRTVTFAENDTVQIAGSGVGTGASVTVTAQRDRVLDQAVQQATDVASSSSTRLAALTAVQSIFTISSSGADSSGVQTALSSFFSGVSAMAADPTSASARQTALAAAQTLASTFNSTAAQLAGQTSTLNQTVSTDVAQANSLLQSIADKNSAISSSQPGADTSTLQDERTALVTQLSTLIGVQQTTTENGSITIATTNGTLLVGGSKIFPLSTSNVSGTTRVFANSSAGGADITSALSGGAIGGSIQVRDTDIPAVSTQLDQLAYSVVTTVNAQNKAGIDGNGLAGGDVFVGGAATGAAASMKVTMVDGSSFAAASTSESTGGSSNANAMLALQNAATVNGQTYTAAYSTMLSGLGTTVSSATTDNTANAAIQTQLTTQRDSISGVSLDEEAANLTQYQRSYQAAAKVLAILNELMASAINLGTSTSVS